MRSKTALLILFIILLFPGSSFAQIYLPPVSSSIKKKVSIFVPNLRAVGQSSINGKKFTDVLKADLKNAALFNVNGGSVLAASDENIDFDDLFEKGVDYIVTGQFQSNTDKTTFAVRVFDVKQETPVLGRNYNVSSGNVRYAAHGFASLIMKQLTGIDGFFESKIAFVLGSNQTRNLYMMDYDGNNVSLLTKHNSLLLSPDCSRDGAKIIFNSDKNWDQDIYVINSSSGLNERRITKGFALDQSAAWSPDGRRFAFSRNGDIFIANANGSGIKKLTTSYAIEVSPAWSPDGRKLAFVSDKSGKPQIYTMNTNGSGVRQLTYAGYNTDPAWSTETSVNKIAFVRVEGSGANIYTIKPDGSDEQVLTSRGRNENPAWSPDGHYIAFSSTKGGSKDIYMMYLNGENQVKLSTGGGKSFPTWCKR